MILLNENLILPNGNFFKTKTSLPNILLLKTKHKNKVSAGDFSLEKETNIMFAFLGRHYVSFLPDAWLFGPPRALAWAAAKPPSEYQIISRSERLRDFGQIISPIVLFGKILNIDCHFQNGGSESNILRKPTNI